MLIALLAAVQAQAGGIRDFLLSEPGVVFRTLPQAARAGLVANAELGKSRTTEATNRMGNTSKIDTLTTDYVAVQLSGSSSIALKMLNKGKADTVIAVIETVSTPARDSRITFYDTRWKQLPAKKCIKQLPTMRDFFKPATPKSKLNELLGDIDFQLIELQWTGAGFNTLTATHSLKSFYSKEDYQKWAPYLVDTITYHIEGTTLKPDKKQ